MVAIGIPGTRHSPEHKSEMEDRMDRLDDYLQRINEGRIDVALQNEIADRILELLEQEKASLGARKKTLFAQAITALSTSINSIYQPHETGLRRCLKDLQKAMTPENEPDKSYAEGGDESENISYAMLVTTVKLIKGEFSKCW